MQCPVQAPLHCALPSASQCMAVLHAVFAGGLLETPEDEVMCVMDVLEEVGDDVARRCYWDFGDWSDLWRDTKLVPTGVSLQVRRGLLKGIILATSEVQASPVG